MTTVVLEPGRIPADPSVCDDKPELQPDAIMERVMAHLAGRAAGPTFRGAVTPLWSLVGEYTGLGSGYSSRVCVRYGYDPGLLVRKYPRRYHD